MNRGLVGSQLNAAWKIICGLKLDMYRVFYPNYCGMSASTFRGLSYLETWQKCFKEQFYDFQLYNSSLLQFRVESFRSIEASYAYYECPYKCMPYREFVNEILDRDISEVGDTYMLDYEQYVSTCVVRETVTPLRYDYKPDHYTEGRHPASHVHFGHMNEIRIATRKVMATPLSFLLMVVRQYYPDAWAELLSHPEANIWCKNVRACLEDVDGKYWGPQDQFEMVLH